MPLAAGNVAIFAIRNRSRVTGAPVSLVQVRRKSTVPNVELFGASIVLSRTLLGAEPMVEHSSKGDLAKFSGVGPSEIGLERFLGPGAPSRCPAPALVPFV